MPVMTDALDQARFLGQYTRKYHAGAFAHPTAHELATSTTLDVRDEKFGSYRAIVVSKVLSRESQRLDFTGHRFTLPAGARVATHVAHTPYWLPDLAGYDYVRAYAEDKQLSEALRAMGFGVYASTVTSAAEIINTWSANGTHYRYPHYDAATVLDMGHLLDDGVLLAMGDEIRSVQGWDDDFPYYSDGGWHAVCLKGFWPTEPGKGVKPTEMPKSWKIKHPDDLARTAQWTTLAAGLPLTTEVASSIPWITNTERIRLLRMRAGSKLGRHTDITDRDGGTRDGQITRFHIPLITHPGVGMITWELDGRRVEQHLYAGRVYYLDARKPHAVTNNSPIDRVHLVIDVVTDEAVRDMISARYDQNAA